MAKKKKAEKAVKEVKETGGSTTKTIIIFTVILLVVGAVSFTGFYFFLKSQTPELTAGTNVTTDGKKALPRDIKEAYLDLGEEFLVNLADDSGKRYVKAKVVIKYNEKDKDFVKAIDNNKIILRDSTIEFLRGKSVKDFKEASSMEEMKKEFLQKLNKDIGRDCIFDVYFQSLIVQ